MSMSDAAIAEIEAGVYGLQVQNNHFDEFIYDLIKVSPSLVLHCFLSFNRNMFFQLW